MNLFIQTQNESLFFSFLLCINYTKGFHCRPAQCLKPVILGTWEADWEDTGWRPAGNSSQPVKVGCSGAHMPSQLREEAQIGESQPAG